MINAFAKFLVLIHACFSIGGMTWAILLVVQARDFGWIEPFSEDVDGKATLHASEYDKSWAAAMEAKIARDQQYFAVKPAVDGLRNSEPHLAQNHLLFKKEIERLRTSKEKIDVKRLKPADTEFGPPIPEDAALANITKSLAEYQQDLSKILGSIDIADVDLGWTRIDIRDLLIALADDHGTLGEIDHVQDDISDIVRRTRAITRELTGTNDDNKYVQPGLNQLADLEFRTQAQIKNELEAISPHHSRAAEQARNLRIRHNDLQTTLNKLLAAPGKKK